jgi:hypothetical protein
MFILKWRPLTRLIVAQIAGTFAACLPAAENPVAGRPLPRWERGMLDIHQINTGTGDAALFILPDPTEPLGCSMPPA